MGNLNQSSTEQEYSSVDVGSIKVSDLSALSPHDGFSQDDVDALLAAADEITTANHALDDALARIAAALDGKVRGERVYAAAPGEGADGDGLVVWPDPDGPYGGGLVVLNRHDHAADSAAASYIHVFRKLGLLIEHAPANDNRPATGGALVGITGADLLKAKFPPVRFVVPSFIPEGLTILGGRPKLGKSWLVLDMVVAVASGGNALGSVTCEQGDALYLALEDNDRRLQDRLRMLMPKLVELPDLSRVKFVTQAPRLDRGLIDALDDWREGAADPRLIVIDTFAMVRPPKKNNQDSYAADYAAVSPLQRYAAEHGIAILLVTHVRKAEAEDPLEAVSGTNGQTGAADTILVLNRDATGPKLYGRGRDIEDIEKALTFEAGRWSVLGNAADIKMSGERRKIAAALVEAGRALGPQEIADETGMKVTNVKYLLRKMVEAGEAEKITHGVYGPPSLSSLSSLSK